MGTRPLPLLCSLIAVVFLVSRAKAVALPKASPLHILFVVVDDLGWSDVGFHGSKIETPNIDGLAAEGVELDNYYVLPVCTPTRSAFMTGRYPIHTGMQHFVLGPASPYGLPLNFTTLPQKMKELGYATHMVGKWHLGYNKWAYTPTYRGFDSFYGYYNGAEDHYTHEIQNILDLRDDKEPVRDLNGTYATFAFTKRATEIIKSHDPSNPLFMYMAFQNCHGPVQAPEKYTEKYSFITDETRRTYAGMVSITDEAIGNITQTMKDAGLWEDTLMVLTTDNGGIHSRGGYNYPLRGEKTTLWEGGVRGVSFVHGNMLGRKGVKSEELMHATDWYPTLVNLAGGDADQESIPLDGMDVWNTISHGDPSPRKEILLNIDPLPFDNDDPSVSFYEGVALRSGHMKILMGINNDTWYTPPELGGKSENKHVISHRKDQFLDLLASTKENVGSRLKVVLYNVTADPTEHEDLSEKLPDVVKELQERVQYYIKGMVPPFNKLPDPRAFIKAELEGIWTPWQD